MRRGGANTSPLLINKRGCQINVSQTVEAPNLVKSFIPFFVMLAEHGVAVGPDAKNGQGGWCDDRCV